MFPIQVAICGTPNFQTLFTNTKRVRFETWVSLKTGYLERCFVFANYPLVTCYSLLWKVAHFVR